MNVIVIYIAFDVYIVQLINILVNKSESIDLFESGQRKRDFDRLRIIVAEWVNTPRRIGR